MNYVFNEYEIKTKMVQEQWIQLKMPGFFELLVIRGIEFSWREGEFFQVAEWTNFCLVRGFPQLPSREPVPGFSLLGRWGSPTH